MDGVDYLLLAGAVGLAVFASTQSASADTNDASVTNYGGTNWTGALDLKNPVAGINQGRLRDFASAVVPTEGGPGDLNYRNNNPGNLKYAGQSGATGADANGFAVFPTYAAGFQALQNQVAKNAVDYPNFTLLQWAKHYLGMDPNSAVSVTSEGNALTKAESIANSLGVSVNTTLSQILGV